MDAAALMVLAASMRLALSGNRPAPAEALDQDIIANARIHSGSSQRSRRSPSLTRAPVPASVSHIVGPPSAGGRPRLAPDRSQRRSAAGTGPPTSGASWSGFAGQQPSAPASAGPGPPVRPGR